MSVSPLCVRQSQLKGSTPSAHSTAQARYLGDGASKNLTDTVINWRSFTPRSIPMPHPSPRNQRWLVRNPWFEDEVIPYVQRRLRRLGLR